MIKKPLYKRHYSPPTATFFATFSFIIDPSILKTEGHATNYVYLYTIIYTLNPRHIYGSITGKNILVRRPLTTINRPT